MTPYRDNRGGGGISPSEEAIALPSRGDSSRFLGSEFVNLLFSVESIDGNPTVRSLQVEAVHPKVIGDKRVFDLSFLLPHIAVRNPTTLAQIVDPQLSMDARIDALRVGVINIAGVTTPLLPLNEPRYAVGHSPSADGFEPSFSVRQVVLTQFGDLLRGFSRRGITVIRNGEPWIQFHIVEGRSGLCDASLVVLPTGLELPLLDRGGRAVTDETLNEAVHEFTHLLLKGRYEPELKVLEAMASELTSRLKNNPEAPASLTRRNFGHEILLSAHDGLLWSKSGEDSRSHTNETLPGRYFEPRELPDGRVLWIRHQYRRLSSEVSFVMDSLEGAQCVIAFHYPTHAHSKVSRVARRIAAGTAWPMFQEITDLLHSFPRSGLSLMIPTSTDSYPPPVNALTREIERTVTGIECERGLFREGFDRFDRYLPDFVSELVKGRSPFMVTVFADSPGDMWWVQGFLDRDLRGALFAVNALGGSVVVSDLKVMHSRDSRRANLVNFFKTLAEDSSRLTQNLNYSSGMIESRHNLPTQSWRDAYAYAAMNDAISVCWEALMAERPFPTPLVASQSRWYTTRLSEGVWSVSLLSRGREKERLPHLINFKVTPEGVTEIAYSLGRRGLLGSLLGRRVWARGGEVLEVECLDGVVRAIAQSVSGRSGESFRRGLRHVSPALECSLLPLASLRDADPDHKRHNVLARLWDAIKGIF